MRESNDDKLPNDFSALKALKAEKDVNIVVGKRHIGQIS